MMTHVSEAQRPPAGVYPAIRMPEVSRRDFLKLLGISVAAASMSSAGASATPATLSTLKAPEVAPLLKLLAGDVARLLEQAFDELGALGLPFALEQGSLFSVSDHPTRYGLLLQDTLQAPRRLGADIALTVDLAAPERAVLYYLVGQSEEEGLQISTTLLTTQGERHQARTLLPRGAAQGVRGPVLSQLRHALTSSQLLPGESADEPPVLFEHTEWYYGHAAEPRWAYGRGADGRRELQLRLATAQEFRNIRQGAAGLPHFAGWQSERRSVVVDHAPAAGATTSRSAL